MPDPIIRDQLKRWADQVSARTELPRLIRHLIAETTPELVKLGMPAGEGASAPGWDGTVKTTKATPWVPYGLSQWEMSVDKNPSRKASADYKKRLTTADGSPTGSATYVALLLREWKGREQWTREQSAEGRWKEVRAYGLDDVDAWLEEAPVTRAWWLAEQMGLHPYGYRSAEQWWNGWASHTNPNLPHALVIAGRDEQAERLVERLQDGPQITTIHGASSNEVYAFIVACAKQVETARAERLLAGMAFVYQAESWRELLNRSSSLILIPMKRELLNDLPASSPHHIIVPIRHKKADIELPRIDAHEAATILQTIGMNKSESTRAGRLARRSLETLRIDLSIKPGLLTPNWAKGSISQTCRAVLLASSWRDELDGDQEVLSSLSGKPYEVFLEELEELSQHDSPLADTVGGSWYLIEIEIAWYFLSSSLTKADLNRLETICNKVLKERDPALDLDPSNRWLASIKNKQRSYSSDLRSGLAKTLILLSLHGQNISAPSGMNGSDWASYLVRELMPSSESQSLDQVWISLADVLPLLAEAAPDRFIRAIQESLEIDPCPLAAMFSDNGSSIHSTHSPHTNLLWALETLAWSSDYFGAVVNILATLDKIDPGGRLANRPLSTLWRLFCPWYANTSLSLSGRIEVLDNMRKHHSECTWRLIFTLISDKGPMFPTQKPKFRNWEPGKGNDDKEQFNSTLVSYLIEAATDNTERLCELTREMYRLPQNIHNQIIDALKLHIAQSALSIEDQSKLRHAIQGSVQRLKSYTEARVDFPSQEIGNRLQIILGTLDVTNPIAEHKWLFESYCPNIGRGMRIDPEEYMGKLAIRRQEAIANIYQQLGIEGVLQMASESSASQAPPWAVGDALWDSVGEDVESIMLDLISENISEIQLRVSQAYFAKKFSKDGWDWLEPLLKQDSLSNLQKARLLSEARDYPSVWEVVASLEEAVRTIYWKSFDHFRLDQDSQSVEMIAQQLIDVDRPCAALDALNLCGIESANAALLSVQALERIAGLSSTDNPIDDINVLVHMGFQAQNLFDKLYEYLDVIGENRLATLEWRLLKAFDLKSPKTLYRLMMRDASFFVEIVTMAFRPKHHNHSEDSHSDDSELSRVQATNAYSLIYICVPAGKTDGEDDLSLSMLIDWVTEVRRLLIEADRVTVGEQCVGQILGTLSADPDEMQPAIVVRDLLEQVKCQNIEQGIFTAIRNGRGITSRGLEDGGFQELELVSEYRDRASSIANRWPRTAGIWRALAESYEHEARSADGEAERFRSGLDS